MKRLLITIALIFAAAAGLRAQTVVPVPFVKPQYLDANGHPYASGCLWSYSAGTSSPAATFVDATGTTQNTNPVILGADGRPPQGIFLGAQTYKLVLFSAGGTNCVSGPQIWSVDGIPGSGVASTNTSFANLTPATNANAGTFAATGNIWDFTGATAFKPPTSAGFAPTANSIFGYNTTNNSWAFGQNGTSVSFGLSSNACAANQFVNTPATSVAGAGCAQPSAANLSDAKTGSGAVVLATSPTITTATLTTPALTTPTINTGVANNGTGFQHLRFTSCNPASGVFCTGTATWNASFANASYTAICMAVYNGTNITNNGPYVSASGSKAAGSFPYQIEFPAAFTGTVEIDCVGIHD